MSDADFIQRLPALGDRWRGLTNAELQHVIVALESDVQMYRDQEDRDAIEFLYRDADAELTRRGGQPDEPGNEKDHIGVRMPWNHRQEIQRQWQPGAPDWQGPE